MLEVASPSTYRHDLTRKKDLYASILGVREYYIYDPYHEVNPYFLGYRLVEGTYQEIEIVNGRMPSVVLGLELGERDGIFGLYDPRRSVWLQPLEEQIKQADARVEQEAEARHRAEAELAEALAKLKRLQKKTDA